jgi:hypothetical protein
MSVEIAAAPVTVKESSPGFGLKKRVRPDCRGIMMFWFRSRMGTRRSAAQQDRWSVHVP